MRMLVIVLLLSLSVAAFAFMAWHVGRTLKRLYNVTASGCFTAIMGAVMVAGLLMAAGCGTTKITEYDSTGKVTKVTETPYCISQDIVSSTKDKTLIVWDTGWLGGIRYTTTPTPDNPAIGSLELMAGKQNKGYIAIKKEDMNTINNTAWEGIAKVIGATDAKAVSVSKDGIGETPVTK